MSYGTSRKESPSLCPSLYRAGSVQDILDANVKGLYTLDGSYWRKNGQPQAYKRNINNARVPVKYGLYGYDTVNASDVSTLFVKLSEI